MIATGTQEKDISLERKVAEIGKQVGNTPLYTLGAAVYHKPGVQIYAKKEWVQIGGSVKARAADSIIRKAVETGELNRHKMLLDATSGNTGIAYAAISKERVIKVSLCLPENASI